MAPHATYDESPIAHDVDIHDLKAKVVVKQVELEVDAPKPVADDFMYDFKYNHALPTTDVLGVEVPANCDAQHEAENFVSLLSRIVTDGDAEKFADLFLDYGETSQ